MVSRLKPVIPPVVITSIHNRIPWIALAAISWMSVPTDTSDNAQMPALIKGPGMIHTRFIVRRADLTCRLALEAVRTTLADDAGMHTIAIERHLRVEKVPGGEAEDSRVLPCDTLNVLDWRWR